MNNPGRFPHVDVLTKGEASAAVEEEEEEAVVGALLVVEEEELVVAGRPKRISRRLCGGCTTLSTAALPSARPQNEVQRHSVEGFPTAESLRLPCLRGSSAP